MKNNNFKEIYKYVAPYKIWLIFAAVSAMINSFISVFITYEIKDLGDYAGKLKGRGIYEIIACLGVLIALGVIFNYTELFFTSKYKNSSICSIRNYINYNLISLPLLKSKEYSTGDVVSRLNNDLNILDIFLEMIPKSSSQPLLFILSITYMMILNPKLLLICTVLIPVSSLLYDKINKPVQQQAKKKYEEAAVANEKFSEMINGIAIVKSYNLNKELIKKYEISSRKIVERSLKIDKINSLLFPIFLALRFIPQLICPLFGGYMVLKGQMTIGALLAFMMLIWYVFLPVEEFLKFISKLREVKPAAARILELAKLETEDTEKFDFKINNNLPIDIKNLSFSYENDKVIIDNISLKINNSATTAIVGCSGCGKSTLFNIICGFLNDYEGSVKVYGNEVKCSNLRLLRSMISFVSQDTYLFPGTIYENIFYGKIGAKKEEIIKAAEKASAHDFIMKLQNNYNTLLKEGGKNLSGGQRHRIALARAILKDAPILLLDEPTADIDMETEAELMDCIKDYAKNKTLIIIAHRLSTIKDADEIIVFSNGKIERGNHDSLIKNNSIYKDLCLDNKDNDGFNDKGYNDPCLKEVKMHA